MIKSNKHMRRSSEPSSSQHREHHQQIHRNATVSIASTSNQKFNWQPFYQWQKEQWYHYDIVGSFCRLLLTISGVVSRSYSSDPALHAITLGVRLGAALTMVVTAFFLWVMLRQKRLYLAFRDPITMLLHTLVCSYVTASLWIFPTEQSQYRVVNIFRMMGWQGHMLFLTAPINHRLPWLKVTALNCIFVAWQLWRWVPFFCHDLVSQYTDYSDNKVLKMYSAVAIALDYVTGQGQEGTTAMAGAAGVSNTAWIPAARAALQPCMFAQSNNSSSAVIGSSNFTISNSTVAYCKQQYTGQCMAAVSTLNVWGNILFVTFCVVLAEATSRWHWLHGHRPSALSMQGVPAMYKIRCKRSFMRVLLLQLHAILDLPLIMLWLGFSAWYRNIM